MIHRYRRPAVIAASVVPLYFASAILLLQFGSGGAFERWFTLPALFLLFVWTPVLRPLGLTSGTLIEGPTTPTCVVLVILYAMLVYAIVSWLSKWRRTRAGIPSGKV